MKKMVKQITAIFSILSSVFIFSPAFLAASETPSSWPSFKASADRQGVIEDAGLKTPLKVIWKYTPEKPGNGFVDWGPVAANGIVYTGDGLNHVVALDAKSGGVIWVKELVSNIFSVSLSEDSKILYATTAITTKPTATLYALDPKTGEIIWDNMINGQEAVGGMEGAPAIKDGKIYAGYLQYEGHGGVVAYEGATGKLLWHVEVKRFSPYSPVSYADGKLFVGFENKTLNCLDAATGRHLWEQTMDDLVFAAPLISGKVVYVATGLTLYAVDVNKGQIMWQKTLEGHVGHSSLSLFNKTLYVGTTESQLLALKLSDGSKVWTQELKKGSIESSVLIDAKKKVLYIGTQENWLMALSLKDGESKFELKLSEDPRGVWKGAPAIYDGRLYVGSLDRNFYALE